MRKDTLLFLLKPETSEILLAMKKRGFGAGKYNGVGGKVGPEESIEEAAVREAQEEIGVTVLTHHLQKRAVLRFSFEQKPEWNIECHTFITHTWEGAPAESEEMAPRWYKTHEIPFEQMWVDDKHWLPHVLEGKTLDADFHFSNDGSEIVRKSIRVIND